MFWTVIASKRKIEQLNFFDWLSNVKNLVVSNGCEHVQNVIQWDLNSFFFQKLTKIPQRLGAPPFTKILLKCQQATGSIGVARGGGGPGARAPLNQNTTNDKKL